MGCLLEANPVWGKIRGGFIDCREQRELFAYGTPNRVHAYDLGQAVAQLSLQATALGLQVHQMAGINLSWIRQEYSVPDGYVPQTAVAIGYAAKEPLSWSRSICGTRYQASKPQEDFRICIQVRSGELRSERSEQTDGCSPSGVASALASKARTDRSEGKRRRLREVARKPESILELH